MLNVMFICKLDEIFFDL